MNTKTLDNTVTDLIDELHNLSALVERIDRLMLLADDRITAALQRADKAQQAAYATA